MINLNPIIKAELKNGVLNEVAVDNLFTYSATLPDGFYEMVIRKPRKDRSNPQNRYYFGVVLKMISEETGYTPEESHEAMKFLYLRKQYDLASGKKLYTSASTSKLSTVQMEEYLENIRRFAATELSINIPLPNEVDYTDQYEQTK